MGQWRGPHIYDRCNADKRSLKKIGNWFYILLEQLLLIIFSVGVGIYIVFMIVLEQSFIEILPWTKIELYRLSIRFVRTLVISHSVPIIFNENMWGPSSLLWEVGVSSCFRNGFLLEYFLAFYKKIFWASMKRLFSLLSRDPLCGLLWECLLPFYENTFRTYIRF